MSRVRGLSNHNYRELRNSFSRTIASLREGDVGGMAPEWLDKGAPKKEFPPPFLSGRA